LQILLSKDIFVSVTGYNPKFVAQCFCNCSERISKFSVKLSIGTQNSQIKNIRCQYLYTHATLWVTVRCTAVTDVHHGLL